MLHLSTDRLAELGDDTPTAEEAAHLAACAECARERAAYLTIVAMAADARSTITLPLSRWDAIAAELSGAAGAAATPRPGIAPGTTRGRRPSRWRMQAAAALLLCAGGAMLGRASAGAPLLPDRAVFAARTTPAGLAAATRLLGDSGGFASVADARAAQQQSELVYERAAAFLAQHDGAGATGSPVAYRSRLAALDRVISTTREALREVPHDPVINEYYLTTIGQREATLRQLNTSQPSSLQLTSF